MIAVISDSHIPRRAEEIPGEFIEELEEAELNVHCGDLVSEEVLEELEQHGELFAVKGNCDALDIPVSETFERSGIEFGAYHGSGIQPRGHIPTLVETAEKLDAEVLLTGHTHSQLAEKDSGKVLLNPGSCTGVSGGSYCGGNPEMMTLEVKEGALEVTLIELVDGEKLTETVELEVGE
ncbi:MAG: YfcE family phosphodiesterase [Candidatus Nanohaloarchaea archaeon]